MATGVPTHVDREIEELLRIARAAAAIVLEVYATPFEVEQKAPGDPVTAADRRANALICRELEVSFPGEAILAEESVPEDPGEIAARTRKERVFFVDPLDGTRDFARRNGEFAVMIGLAERGRAAAGVVAIPATGELLWGRVGAGGGITDAEGRTRPIQVSDLASPEEATAVVSRSHRARSLQGLLERLGVRRVIPCGSVGVKVARVVTGAADLYVHDVGCKLWDTCAPEAILTAAGGRFSDLGGGPINYASADLKLRNGLIATNGALHEAIVTARAALG